MRHATRVMILGFSWACLASAAFAQTDSDEKPRGILPIPDYGEASSPYLSGDWQGQRTSLAEDGLQVRFVFNQVAQGVVSGGRDTGWNYGGKIESFWNLDLDKMGVMRGGLLTMHTESRYGQSVNSRAGTVLPVNDVLFFPLTDEVDENIPITISELRYTQFLSPDLAVFFGKFIPLGGDINEFAGGRGDSQFMSHPFLTASVTSLINPYSTLGAGVNYSINERVTVSSSLYLSGDSSTTSGFDQFGEGWVWNSSIRNQYRIDGLPGGMMLSGQYGFGNSFTNFRGQFVGEGGVAIPLVDDTWNVFWNGWQYLHVKDDSKALIKVGDGRVDRRGYGLFARAGMADRDTNPAKWVVSGGLGGRGMIGGRENDSFGVGYALGEVYDQPFIVPAAIDDGSTHRFEAYYSFETAPGAELTFDVQHAESFRANVDAATILGLRFRLQF